MTSPTTRQLDLCAFCPDLCLDVCPVGRASGDATWSPWGKMSLLRALERGLIGPDPSVVDALHACVGCLACTNLCEHAQPVADLLFEARGRVPPPQGLPDEAPWSGEDALARVIPEARRSDEALAVYLPGREVLEARPQAARAAIALLDALGADEVGVPRAAAMDEGARARELGRTDAAARLGRDLAMALSRFKRVLVHGPHAAYLLRTWLPLKGHRATARVDLLVDDLAARLGDRPPPGPPDRRTIAVHDACLFARGGGDPAALRRLLTWASGRMPRELAHHGADTWCCGRGAGYHERQPEVAARIARLAVDEAKATGADLLVTSCPAAAAAFEASGMPAQDISEYLADRLARAAGGATEGGEG